MERLFLGGADTVSMRVNLGLTGETLLDAQHPNHIVLIIIIVERVTASS